MGRPREFEPDAALDKAMHLFWEQGYEATSMQELVDAMGINRGSLYSTFGNKEQLFQAAIDRYCEQATTAMLDLLAQRGAPKQVLRAFFDAVIEQNTAAGPKRGCFMTNTTVELASKCGRTAEKVSANRTRMEDAICKVVKRAKARGNKPRAVARFLLNTMSGLTVAAKGTPRRADLREIVDVALTVLD